MPSILPTGDWNYAGQPKLVDLVSKMSNGRLQITVFPAGQLSGPAEIFDGIKAGLFEGGFYAGAYKAGLDPIFSIEWGIPVGAVPLKMQEMWTLYYEKGLDKVYEEAYAEHGIKWIGQFWTGHYVGMTKFPVKSIDDLKGRKLRTVGAAAETLTKLGAAVTFIPVPEIYTALATGTIDGAWFGPAPVYTSVKMYEVAKTLVLPPLVSPTGLAVLASQDAWNKLPDDLKAIVTEGVRTVSAWNYSRANYETAIAAKEMAAKGVTVVEFKGEDLAKFEAAGRAVWNEMPKTSAKAQKAKKIVDDFMRELGYVK